MAVRCGRGMEHSNDNENTNALRAYVLELTVVARSEEEAVALASDVLDAAAAAGISTSERCELWVDPIRVEPFDEREWYSIDEFAGCDEYEYDD